MATEAEILTKLNDLLDDISETLDAAGASKLVTLDRSTGADVSALRWRTNAGEHFRIGLLDASGNLALQRSPDGSALSWTTVLTVDRGSGAIGIGTVPAYPFDIAVSGRLQGTWRYEDAQFNWIGTGGNFPSISYRTTGATGRFLATGFDPSGELVFWNRWDPVTDGYLGQVMEMTQTGELRMTSTPVPVSDNAVTLGSASARWSVVYAATGTINTSDQRLKADVGPCPLGLDFIKALSPVIYRWTVGGHDISWPDLGPGEMRADPIVTPRAGVRQHLGLLAQNVKAALDAAGVDAGLWVLEDPADPASTQSLRYDQMIAPLVAAVQDLAARNDALEARIAALEAAAE
jgi:hypothetical protein